MTLVYTPAGQAKRIEMDVLRGCVDDLPTRQGFLLDPTNQFIDNDDGQSYQPLWERSCYPIGIRTKMDTSKHDKMLDALYVEHKEMAIEEEFENTQKDKMSAFLWIISVVCATFIIIAGMRFFFGG